MDRSIVTVWRIKSGIWTGILVLAVLIWDILNFFDADRAVPFGVWPAVAILILLIFVLWLPSLRYRFWKFELRPEELLLIRGVFNRVHTIVPLRRIQHLDVSQDLFEREYDVAKLIVHTAGTRTNAVVLPGLHQDDAESLRDIMKEFITDEAL